MPERIAVLRGRSAGRDVLLGFARADVLYRLSFADVLDEDTGKGYQRRFSEQHSLDFRRYIRQPGSTTIPLTFNLRPETRDRWSIEATRRDCADLVVQDGTRPILAQVDCQHRLGHIGDIDVVLPFMMYVGLSEREEMEIFNTINSKAKGLSSSLLDYHDARLVSDIASERPELFIALQLNDNESSPWYRQLELGGTTTSGLQRRASLRTIQKAVKRFLASSSILATQSPQEVASVVQDYWAAIASVLSAQWRQPRRHFLTKGVGVYALMGVLSDIWKDAKRSGRSTGFTYFVDQLSDFATEFDWSNSGPLKGLGGESGALAAQEMLRAARLKAGRTLTGVGDG